MSWSFPIGRLLGSELRVHATFLLLIVWIGGAAWAQSGPEAALVNVVYVLALFVCVIAHEYGHALTARRYGIKTPDITLLPIGGLARLEKMPENPVQEILVALAGPMVNVVIFLLLWAVLGADIATPLDGDMTFADLPRQLATLNLFLALFNLIPAFPMDGGRVLRAALALFMDRVKATRVAAGAGQVVAVGFGLFGLASGNLILLIIAFFIFAAAGAESSDLQIRSFARRFLARDAMIVEFESLRPDDSLDMAGTTLIRTTQQEFPVVDPGTGRIEGVLTRHALYAALSREDKPHRVSEVMDRNIPEVSLTEGLESVLQKLEVKVPAVAVTGADHALVGYITRENVGELMVIAHARD